jgi:hypothetical protein
LPGFPPFGFLGKLDPRGFSFAQVYSFFDSDCRIGQATAFLCEVAAFWGCEFHLEHTFWLSLMSQE